tara:strand:+ start:442 stop:792 length:351 start_codon:yes stop_codon:yes gene_type:complete
MPFVEFTIFKKDKTKVKTINNIINYKICKNFKIKKNIITIYSNLIDSNNYYHDGIYKNKEKRIFIKIFGFKRTLVQKQKLANILIKSLKKLMKINKSKNIAVYYFDLKKNDIFHGK